MNHWSQLEFPRTGAALIGSVCVIDRTALHCIDRCRGGQTAGQWRIFHPDLLWARFPVRVLSSSLCDIQSCSVENGRRTVVKMTAGHQEGHLRLKDVSYSPSLFTRLQHVALTKPCCSALVIFGEMPSYSLIAGLKTVLFSWASQP